MADFEAVLFLDVDGVLNRCGFGRESYDPMLVQECIREFNRVIASTGAKVVLSSSWRYMVLGGSMTIRGFQSMLLTHRARCRVIGTTPADEDVVGRGYQIAAWLQANPAVTRYLVIDDEDGDITECGHPLVLTDGLKGLTSEDADRAIAMLNGVGVGVATVEGGRA